MGGVYIDESQYDVHIGPDAYDVYEGAHQITSHADAPTISSFTATPAKITAPTAGTVRLAYAVQGATSLALHQRLDEGATTDISNLLPVSPGGPSLTESRSITSEPCVIVALVIL